MGLHNNQDIAECDCQIKCFILVKYLSYYNHLYYTFVIYNSNIFVFVL